VLVGVGVDVGVVVGVSVGVVVGVSVGVGGPEEIVSVIAVPTGTALPGVTL
jgi:hypothetical protein